MNTLKPLLIVAVLAGIGYGVYVRINNGSDAPPPPGAPQGWEAQPPVIQLSEGGPAGAPAPWPSASAPPSGASAPPFGSLPPTTTAPRAGDAPPYNAAPAADAGNPPVTSNLPTYTPPQNDSRVGAPPIPPEPSVAPPQDAYRDMPPQDAVGAAPPAGPPAAAGYDPAAANAYQSPPVGAPPVASGPGGYAGAMEMARRELEGGQMASALRQLSGYYEDPQLSLPERQQLNQLLDQIAGTVIYSTQHMLESPYEVQQGERLEDIGQRYNVPWQLLAKINGIEDPSSLRAGERLKVMRGPFSAVVSLEKRQLTLLLGDGSYAGRFAIGIGREQPPQEGTYAVSDKVVNPVYRGREQTVGSGDAANPLGDRWIGLGTNLGIHGTNRPDTIGRTDLPGSISLNPRDVEDVYDILSVGSKVTIRR